jgi:hypothetical protein
MCETLAPGKVAPLAIDRHGRHYGVRWNGSAMEFFVDHGKHLRTARAEAGDVNQIVPSPDGKRFVAVHQRGQVTSLSMHDSDSLEEKWSYSTAVFANEIVWSEDGALIGVASNTGAVVLDAADGKPKRKRCGIQFEASGSPPPNPFNGMGVHSICEG